MKDIYINSNLNLLTKVTSNRRSTNIKGILPCNISHVHQEMDWSRESHLCYMKASKTEHKDEESDPVEIINKNPQSFLKTVSWKRKSFLHINCKNMHMTKRILSYLRMITLHWEIARIKWVILKIGMAKNLQKPKK